MKTQPKILIALDFHPSATKVIEAGILQAKRMDGKVVLLHIKTGLVNYSLIYKKMGPLKLESVADLESAAHKFLEKSKHHIGDNMIQIIVKQGDFAESLIKTAREMDVDMIVMGSHSTQWLEEIVLGRVTNEVLQQITIPIMIIPTRKQNKRNTLISLEIK
jgi:nucleotide-binding universal stress UspA family protein